MFLLFLGLGTASVNAQVRIGGNTAPNGAAVLDLNATDATNNGTKGLALPRVNLTSNTMQLTSGVVNLTGMLVYNTTATLGAVGIYVWTGAQWTKVNLPNTSAADSGKFLMYNGSTWVASAISFPRYDDTLRLIAHLTGAVTWTKVLDTIVTVSLKGGHTVVPASGVLPTDICKPANNWWPTMFASMGGIVMMHPFLNVVQSVNERIVCLRPSI